MNILTRDYEGLAVQFQTDAWFNATVAAKKFGKFPRTYLEMSSTVDYIVALHDHSLNKSSHLYNLNQEVI